MIVKDWLKHLLVLAAFVAGLVGIALVLRFMLGQQDEQQYHELLYALYNLFFIPILLAAFIWDERVGATVGLFATLAVLYVATNGAWWTPDWAVWSGIGIRGSFFVVIGYLGGLLMARVRANAREWHSLLEISRSINASLDMHQTLETITRFSVEVTTAHACAIRLVNEETGELVYASVSGLSETYLKKGVVTIHESPLMQNALRGQEASVFDVRESMELPYREAMVEEGIVWLMSLPLRVEDRVIGLLNLYRKHSVGFTHRDRRVGRAFAEQASTAIQNARLYDSIRSNYLDTVRALTRAIEAKDPTTLGHSERVVELSLRLAQTLALPAADLEMLQFGAMLHDIGKIGLDEQTLVKTGRLTVDEQILIEMHPLIGKSIIDPIAFLRPCIPIVFSHHERWDGSGYPEGLSSAQIPLLARIVAFANALDHEMYGHSGLPVTEAEALARLRAEPPGRLDPHLLEVFPSVSADSDFTSTNAG